MKRDPICNMVVDEGIALQAECDGEIFYFCSEGCRERFMKERICRIPRTSYDLIIVGGGPAGDVTNAFGKRIIIASGEGAKAALAARQYILDIKKEEKTW